MEINNKGTPPINRSVSLDSIQSIHKIGVTNDNNNNNHSNPSKPMSLDDMATMNQNKKYLYNYSVSSKGHLDQSLSGENSLLMDLDDNLRNKLRVMDSVLSSQPIKRKISNNLLHNNFLSRAGLDGNVTAISNSESMKSLEDNIDTNLMDAGPIDFQILSEPSDKSDIRVDNEEDDEFTNVDEIDGPISGLMKDLSISTEIGINQQQIGNESKMDYNMPVDDKLQENLRRRAAEFEYSNADAPSLSIPKVDWSVQEFYGLSEELNNWFSLGDYTNLPPTVSQFSKYVKSPEEFLNNEKYARDEINSLIQKLVGNPSGSIMALTCISLGLIPTIKSTEQQIKFIKRNNILLMESDLKSLLDYFTKTACSCRDDISNLKKQTILLFYSSTILFNFATVCIEERKKNAHTKTILNTIKVFDDNKILQFLTKYIEHWRWNSRLSMRVRNIIALLFKLFTLQFGDGAVYTKSKRDISELHDISIHEEGKILQLKASALQYEAFREDIISRFPDFEPPKDDLPNNIDNSNSLSQFLEIPRSKVRNPINSTLAVPENHLATPAPSPPGSPTLMLSGPNPKPRRSFQTNMAYPCLYPSDDESGNDALSSRINGKHIDVNVDHDVIVPYSIQEATKILSENLQIKLSNKQLWHERDLFMMTERGWKLKKTQDPFNYLNIGNESNNESINIMKRIDSYYSDCLSSFNSLIFVLLQTAEANMSNVDYKDTDSIANNTPESIAPHLEIKRAKELSLRSSSAIIYLLLRWFKLNHILKYEHICVLLYDSHFISLSTTLLNKYSEVYLDKIFNKMISPGHSIWIESAKYLNFEPNRTNRELLDKNILSCFTYLLKTLRKVTGNKTQRLKDLPLSIGVLFRRYFRVLNLDIYHPILKIVKELTPFKNKRWKSEHMELISGVYLYEKLELIDNWVTGKDISNEFSDACGQEIALRALLQFYNFFHYEDSMKDLGYGVRSNVNQCLLNKESESYSV